jgi:hypothetical protein
VGVRLSRRVPHECVAHRSVPRGRAPHQACISWAYTLWACTSWACISLGLHLVGVYLVSMYLMAVYLYACTLLAVHLMGVVCLEAFNLGFLGKGSYTQPYGARLQQYGNNDRKEQFNCLHSPVACLFWFCLDCVNSDLLCLTLLLAGS